VGAHRLAETTLRNPYIGQCECAAESVGVVELMNGRPLPVVQAVGGLVTELVGVFGRAAGMREIEKAAGEGSKRAQLAIDMFVSRAAAGIAAAATALPRLDALVFTGGIGEHSPSVRSAIVGRLAPLGIGAVPGTDIRNDAVISPSGSAVALLRVEAREDAVIARQAAELLY